MEATPIPQSRTQQAAAVSGVQRAGNRAFLKGNEQVKIQSTGMTVSRTLPNPKNQLEPPKPIYEPARFSQSVTVPHDQISPLPDRDSQLQALREEAKRLQEAGWGTVINENTLQVERWVPRSYVPRQQGGYLNKLKSWVKTYPGLRH
jgi:hypothetical protein